MSYQFVSWLYISVKDYCPRYEAGDNPFSANVIDILVLVLQCQKVLVVKY